MSRIEAVHEDSTMVSIDSEKFSAEYQRDCSRAEEEAIRFLCNVHMPVINIPSLRDLTLANFKRRMVKCDGKVRETDIVLVATTDFVASALACPTLFHWNLEEHSEQVAALLQDLGRRWTRLMTVDESRRLALAALLETSVMGLTGAQYKHFEEALLVARQPARTRAPFFPEVEGFGKKSQSFSPEAEAAQKMSCSAVSESERAWRLMVSIVPPKKGSRKTLLSFFSKGVPKKSAPDCAARDCPNETGGIQMPFTDAKLVLPSPLVKWVGTVAPMDTKVSLVRDKQISPVADQGKTQEYSTSQGKVLVYPYHQLNPPNCSSEANPSAPVFDLANHTTPALNATNPSVPMFNLANPSVPVLTSANPSAPGFNLANPSVPVLIAANLSASVLNVTNHGKQLVFASSQGKLVINTDFESRMLVNTTNQSVPLVNATNHNKPVVNALLVMMNAAKENQRKRAAGSIQGKGKLARKGW